MILLDTDHLTVLQSGKGDRFDRLVLNIAKSKGTLATTIANVEEQMRGWLASIAKERRIERQVKAYRELLGLFARFAKFTVVPFDETAANRYSELRTGRGHLGTQDVKIASISLVRDALLLTANTQDFIQIPELRFENWLDS